jgi:hypothetical protein
VIQVSSFRPLPGTWWGLRSGWCGTRMGDPANAQSRRWGVTTVPAHRSTLEPTTHPASAAPLSTDDSYGKAASSHNVSPRMRPSRSPDRRLYAWIG